ncbi:dipeptide ABC transporter ATP-binding protein [Streptomyces halobius]|uniref:ABC transporter ATP-binding protein n=1 Tax=Streptomyces halobius TaxID=2879846 RepID=A0ABY4M5T9_9ACTN|nr:ABC transporter ATP-binding protein [Streptomyces halobius]UQA91741.1 ABC transporter ATP-binding protein [Streptomyces halobius]
MSTDARLNERRGTSTDARLNENRGPDEEPAALNKNRGPMTDSTNGSTTDSATSSVTDSTTGSITDPLLTLDDLRVEITGRGRTVHALDGVDLDLAPGEALGIVGESGCGKTMTALAVLGLLPNGGRITGGRVLFDGTDLAAAPEPVLRDIRGNTIGTVFQDPLTSLNPTLTIGAQVAEPLLLHTESTRAEAWAKAEETLRLVGMPRPGERMKQHPHQLSGGMRQRVAIAMALVCEPRLLIADEPTTALDVTTRHQILELIDELRERLGMAMILVTHDLGVIARRVDRVAVMYGGRIAERAPVRPLFAAPRHRYTQALLAALPAFPRGPVDGAPATGDTTGATDAAEYGTKGRHSLFTVPGLPPSLVTRPVGCRFAPRCGFVTDICRATEPELTGDGDGHGDGGGGAGVGAGRAGKAGIGPGGARGAGGPDGRCTGTTHDFACFHPVDPAPGADAIAEVRPPAPATPPVRTDETVLRLVGVSKSYPLRGGPFVRRKGAAAQVSAVAGVSLTVRRGETFGIVGESGCGKSTVARMVVGLEAPTGGTVHFAGRDISTLTKRELRTHRREVQLMFQDSYAAMDPRMRVGAVLREPLAIQGLGDTAEQRRRIAGLLDDVGLPRGAVDRYPHEFSGGQRQRLALARALAPAPSLIVADEPVSALDVSVQAQILNLMRDLQRDKGLTYLFISHDLAVVRHLADSVGVMYLGKLVETGPAERVFARPLHPYTRGLLDTVNVPDPDATRAGAPLTGETPSAATPPSGCRFRTRCPAATELCGTTEPPPAEPETPGHRVACHFPLTAESAG